MADEFQNAPAIQDTPQSQDILEDTKGSIRILNSVPMIVMIIGILIIILGFFI